MKYRVIKAEDTCTACGACVNICPAKSISLRKDSLDNVNAFINKDTCIHCNKCNRVCPVHNKEIFCGLPRNCYAAWTNDVEDREFAASGGIASAIYRFCLNRHYKTFGVMFIPGGIAQYIEINSVNDIKKCQNSKYLFSYLIDVLDKIKEYIDAGEIVVVPALPCQAAAIISYCGGRKDNLYIVDIVCHGTCSEDYINQHINKIEKKIRKSTELVCFRDVAEGTEKFILSFYDKQEKFYASRVNAQDTYQLGYHKALIYRDNCYKCEYAKLNRVGDLTISDFSGLGNRDKFYESKNSVSCILVNSDKGEWLLDELKQSYITIIQRPMEEATLYEKQLQHPSIPHVKREIFKRLYKKTGDYDYAAKNALKKELILNRIHYYDMKILAKITLSKIMSRRQKETIKRWLRRIKYE